MRLIDADALLAYCLRMYNKTITPSDITNFPKINVKFVFCKDCKNWMYEYDDVGLCVTDVPDVDGVQRHACDFCSYGERKDNDN